MATANKTIKSATAKGQALDELTKTTATPNATPTALNFNIPQFDVEAAYKNIMDSTKGAADASFANNQQQILGQQAGIGQKYDALNKQAYANARLSSLGNNEAMAAQGLAGNAYAGPQSGYSETSRVAQNAALGNTINSNELARRNALDELTGQINQARTSRDASLLGQEANILSQKASALQQQDQFNKQFALDEAGVTGVYGGQQTLTAKNQADQLALQQGQLTGDYTYTDPTTGQPVTVSTLGSQQLSSDQMQQAVSNAINMLQVTGKVTTKEQADALGVPIGTTSMQYQQMHSGGGGGGGLIATDPFTGKKVRFKDLDAYNTRVDQYGRWSTANDKNAQRNIDMYGNKNITTPYLG